MKKIILILLLALPTLIFATDPPDPGGSPQGSDPPLGGGAPVGGGLFILLSLGAVYGGRKLYQFNKENLEE